MARPRVLLLRPPGSGTGGLERVAAVAHIPVIGIEPVPGAVERLRALLPGCDWLVLTSPRAPGLLEPLVEAIRGLQEEARLRVAAVGPKTLRSLEALGLRADHVPGEYRGAALAEELLKQQPRPGCVLLARSEKAVPDLPRILRGAGVRVEEVPLYRVAALADMAAAAAGIADLFDYVVFTSPSIAEAFTCRYPSPRRPGFTPVAIGPTTAARMRELGYPEPLIPQSYTMEAVADLIAAHWAGRRR